MPRTTTTMSSPPIVGVPSFTKWLSGPSCRMRLPNPIVWSSRMYGGIRITISANASSRPWISSTVTGRPRPGSSRRPSTTRSSPMPRDALTSTTSPVAQPRLERVEGRLGIRHDVDPRPIEAGVRRTLGDAAVARRRRRSATRRRPRPPRRRPDARSREPRRARASRPRTATCRPGRSASSSSAAAPSPVTRCSCRR